MTDEILPIVPGRMPWTEPTAAPDPPPAGRITYGIVPVFVNSEGHALGASLLGDDVPPAPNCAVSFEADAWNSAMMGMPLRRGSRTLAMG